MVFADALKTCGGMVELKLTDSKSPMLTSESQKPKGKTQTADPAETVADEEAETGSELVKAQAQAVAEAEAITKPVVSPMPFLIRVNLSRFRGYQSIPDL